MSESNRVAVVVVHGIADQLPGQTVRELARLLCHGGEGTPRFVQGELSNVLVPVAKLEPGSARADTQAPVTEIANSAHKQESARRQPGTPSGFYQTHKADMGASGAAAAPITAEVAPDSDDLGMALNDYLLGRLQLTESDALYEAAKISLRRKRDDRCVDLYEMYWADLSRLGTGGLLALSTLYQLFFHLTTLSADVVDQVSLSMNGGRGWQWLQRLHAWMAWLMKAPAVIIQLSMLLVVLFGAMQFVPQEQHANVLAVAYGAGAIVLSIAAALAFLHAKSGITRWTNPALLLIAAAACIGLAVTAFLTFRWLAWIYFGTCALVAALIGAWLVQRYSKVTRGVFLAGHLICGATIVALAIFGWQVLSYATTMYEWMLTAALHVFELQLAAMLLVWSAFVIVELIALVLGLWLQRGGSTMIKDSMHTARLTLVVSTGLFTVLSLVLWSVVSYVAGEALSDLRYDPLIFGGADDFWAAASFFLHERVRGLGGFFTPLVVASALLAIAGMMILAPSLLEELAPSKNVGISGVHSGATAWSRRLGSWMGNWMRRLDRILTVVVPVGAIGGGLLFLAFVFQEFALTWSGFSGFASWLASWLAYFQGETLVAAGKWLAGGAVTIAALGSRFTKTFGRLRVVIDAVLDVDNYFGDPPSHQPPRARIFSRFASLLTYLKEANYSRIVIVAHSQGTVISAELLRYLHVKQRLQEFAGTTPVALVTVGSPLRDLYARRFPLLYKWMGSHAGSFAYAGPQAADIGACEWVNACRSGDYVGRFIWTPASDECRFEVASFDANGGVVAQREGDRTEFCLGAGAHTHYFSNDASALTVEIDRLISGDAGEHRAAINGPQLVVPPQLDKATTG